MYLKSLIIKGFKSFADRTVITLEPGVSVVVGPNGSGKSNISDAVLWVLGEQSAKALRGQVMEDVIFAGSSARSAVGVAEVDIVLDNSDGTLPLEFNEVTITRRMFRSGESEYLINQAPARLMDVLDLLHDTGLGKDTHSIISQGQIDEILSSKPEDRRALIEEAAGVLKHKRRKERAVRKLSGLDATIDRARDIATEIDRQLRPLQRQASRAQEHSHLVTELRALELAVAVDDLRRLRVEWDGVEKVEREADAEIELARLRLQERERDLSNFQKLLEEKGLFVGDLSEQRRRMQSILERLDSGLLLLEEKGKNLVERLSDLRQKLHHNESRTIARTAELAKLSEDRGVTDAQLKALYGQLSELRKDSETARKARISADEQLARLNAEIRRARKSIDDVRLEISTLEHTMSTAQVEDGLLGERIAQIQEQRSTQQAALSARRSRLDQVAAALQRARRDLSLAESDVDKRVRVLESRRKDLADRKERYAEGRAELRALEEIDRAFAAASPALAWVLAQGSVEGVIRPVADSVKAPAGHERLVERILGADLFGLFVKDPEAAGSVALTISRNAPGDISLIPVVRRHRPPVKRPSVGTPLIDLIQVDDDVADAVRSLVDDVVVMPDLESALKAAEKDDTGCRFATPDGALVWPDGKVTLGSPPEDAEGVLARKRRLNELGDELSALSASLGEAEAEVTAAEDALSAAQQDALDISQQCATLAGEHTSVLEELGRLEQSITALDAESEAVAKRRAEVGERSQKDQPRREALDVAIAQHTAELERLEEAAAVSREDRDLRFREETQISERVGACQIEIATVSEREVHLKRQVTTISVELKELNDTINNAQSTEVALELLRERIHPLHELYTALQERAEFWAEKLRDRARFEQADSASLRETIYSAQEAVRGAQGEVDEKLESLSEVRVVKAQLEVKVNQAARRIVEDLGMPLETALESDELEDRERAVDRTQRLHKQLANIGPVNPVAASEYEALRSRRESMTAQIEDLDTSRKSLRKVLAAIDRKMRDRFLEAFEEVDRHFQAIFAVLFPGGQAQLALTDPDDPDVTGVEVICQPRGKKLTKLMLMSGGEKSLTAIALLFAVYRTRPCPFYILDEVDAALDDMNLRRFIAFIDSLRTTTQFLVVSHQRRTMETADILYGASMQADGVTKVVGQRLDRDAREGT